MDPIDTSRDTGVLPCVVVPFAGLDHFAGFDWATEKHDLCAVNRDGKNVLQSEFLDTAAADLPAQGFYVLSAGLAAMMDGAAAAEAVAVARQYGADLADHRSQPLTAEQVQALDTLDRVAGERRLRVAFMLRPGEMFFINNRWIFHNRTAFEDHAGPERRRHYARLWLQRPVSDASEKRPDASPKRR